MKRYAEFYDRGLITGEPIPACGSDSIVFLDARTSEASQHQRAAKVAADRGYIGYRIMAYPILPLRPVSQLILI